MAKADLEKLIHVYSKVDYCNCLLTELHKNTVKKLELIQYAAARVLSGNKMLDHVTLSLNSLHCLPVSDTFFFSRIIYPP